jgi:hypothetical protein
MLYISIIWNFLNYYYYFSIIIISINLINRHRLHCRRHLIGSWGVGFSFFSIIINFFYLCLITQNLIHIFIIIITIICVFIIFCYCLYLFLFVPSIFLFFINYVSSFSYCFYLFIFYQILIYLFYLFIFIRIYLHSKINKDVIIIYYIFCSFITRIIAVFVSIFF